MNNHQVINDWPDVTSTEKKSESQRWIV